MHRREAPQATPGSLRRGLWGRTLSKGRGPTSTSRASRTAFHARKVVLVVILYLAVLLMPTLVVSFGSGVLYQFLGGSWWMVPISLFGLLATAAPLVYLTTVRRLEHQ